MNDLPPLPLPNADAASPFAALLRHIPPEEIPSDDDLLSPQRLETALSPMRPYDLLLLGDVMLGDGVAERVNVVGEDYPFAGILPLLRKSSVVIANLEAPFATGPRDPTERFSYRVAPSLCNVLSRAGISAVNLANNHLLDCGRAGVTETLATLREAGIMGFGAGRNQHHAHLPRIMHRANHSIGLLGYYWNPRCTATQDLPGCAVSNLEIFQPAIAALRPHVDLLVVNFHWGDTYQRDPSLKAQAKARLAIDAGADLVVGHHPHVLQPLEIYRSRPIFYSIGNCLMGSGNSRAEGAAVAVRFNKSCPEFDFYPLYVKNRDPRVNYQTRLLTGAPASRLLSKFNSETSKLSMDHQSAAAKIKLPLS